MIELVDETKEFSIKNIQLKNEIQQYKIMWKFIKATHFLICSSDCQIETKLQKFHIKELENDIDELLDRKTIRNELGNWSLITKDDYLIRYQRAYPVSKGERRNVAFKICVYSCEFVENRLKVYFKEETDENRVHIPIGVKVMLQEKKKGFFSKAYVECKFRVAPLDDYIEGAISYKPTNSKLAYPISKMALGKIMIVKLPRNESIHIRVEEEYNKIYAIQVTNE